jgi:hypothetical protein
MPLFSSAAYFAIRCKLQPKQNVQLYGLQGGGSLVFGEMPLLAFICQPRFFFSAANRSNGGISVFDSSSPSSSSS